MVVMLVFHNSLNTPVDFSEIRFLIIVMRAFRMSKLEKLRTPPPSEARYELIVSYSG